MPTFRSEILSRFDDLNENIRQVIGGALSRKNAAAYLGIHPQTLDRLTKAGKIARIELSFEERQQRGGRCRVLYRREELVRYLEDNEQRIGVDSEAKARELRLP